MPGDSREVPGAVLVDPTTRHVSLELDDPLVDGRPLDLSSHPVIHGQLIDGTPVALLDCFQTRAGLSRKVEQPGGASYYCGLFVHGASVNANEQYSQFTLNLTDLVTWVGQRGFQLTSDLSATPPVFAAKTVAPFLAEADTSRGTVRLRSGPAFSGGHRSAEFRTRARIEVLPQGEVTLSEIMSRYVRPLQDLLTIAVGRPQEVTTLRVVPSRNVRPGDPPRGDRDWAEVTFPRWSEGTAIAEATFPSQMLFSLSDIAGSLSASLDAWFRLDDEVHQLRSLVTAPAYRSGMFLDQRFLYAVHAIETYHRRRIGGYERTKEDHARLIREIMSTVPEQHRQWLKAALAFSNELSLLQRLCDIRSKVCERTEHVLSTIDHWEQWVRDTRNWNTHFTKSQKKSHVAEDERLLPLTESLLLVLDDIVLLALGLSDLARNQLLARTARYLYVSQLIRAYDWAAL